MIDKYYYTLCLDDDLDAEIVAWHWHPETDWCLPHIHVCWKEGPIDDFGRVHFPTSHVSYAQVLLFLMRDRRRIKAIAAGSDAAEYLEQKVAPFGEGQRWSPGWSETE